MHHYYISKGRAQQWTSIILSLFYALLLVALPNDLFRDRGNYIRYANIAEYIKRPFEISVYFFTEPFFYYYNKLLLIFISPDIIPKVAVFLIAYTTMYFILSSSRSYYGAALSALLLFFMPFTFHLQLVVLRQAIATAGFIWAVYYFWDNKKILFLSCFLMSLIHVSFFVILFILVVEYLFEKFFKNPKINILGLAIVLFTSSFAFLQLAKQLGVRQANQDHVQGAASSVGGAFILFIFMLVCIYLNGFNKTYSNKFGRLAIIGLVAYIALYFTTAIPGRLMSSFLPFIYIYIAYSKNWKILIAASILLIANLFIFTSSVIEGSLSYIGAINLQRLLS